MRPNSERTGHSNDDSTYPATLLFALGHSRHGNISGLKPRTWLDPSARWTWLPNAGAFTWGGVALELQSGELEWPPAGVLFDVVRNVAPFTALAVVG